MKKRIALLLTPLLLISCTPLKNLYYDNGYLLNMHGDEYTQVEIVDGSIVESTSLKYAFESVISSYIYEEKETKANDIFKLIKKIATYESICFDSDNLFINKDKELVHNLAYLNKYIKPYKPLSLEKETYDLIKIAYEITLLTKGKFNLCIKELSSLWDFYIKNKVEEIDENEIKKLQQDLPTYEEIKDIFIFDDINKTITLNTNKQILITLNALAKGRFLDVIKQNIDKKSLLVDAGSSSISSFGNSYYKTWNINLRNPNYESDEKDEATYLALKKQGKFDLSVSGDYQNYYINQNIRYHHIIDPSTGYPTHMHRSSAIIGDNATFADGLSTVLMMLSLEDNKALIEDINAKYNYNFNFILIDEDENKNITYIVDNKLKKYVSLGKVDKVKISYF